MRLSRGKIDPEQEYLKRERIVVTRGLGAPRSSTIFWQLKVHQTNIFHFPQGVVLEHKVVAPKIAMIQNTQLHRIVATKLYIQIRQKRCVIALRMKIVIE